MQKYMKKNMPFKIDFLCDVGRFWEGEWRQVGSKIEWKIDVNCGRRVFEKRCFSLGKTMILKVREVPRSMKNRLEIEAEDRVALGFDF